jgi:ariadne-1
MDSEDDFNSSQVSEDDFMQDGDSDVDLDEGEDRLWYNVQHAC